MCYCPSQNRLNEWVSLGTSCTVIEQFTVSNTLLGAPSRREVLVLRGLVVGASWQRPDAPTTALVVDAEIGVSHVSPNSDFRILHR